jgi:hypothetical protein
MNSEEKAVELPIGDRGGSVTLSDEQSHAFAVALGNLVIPTGWHDWRDTLRILGATREQRSKALKVALSLKPSTPHTFKIVMPGSDKPIQT